MPSDSGFGRLSNHRRRRYTWAFFLFLFTFVLVLRLRGVDFTVLDRSAATSVAKWWQVHIKEGTDLKVDELKALLYMLTTSDHILPDDLDTNTPMDPSILVAGAQLNPMEWHQRLVLVDRFNPLIVFSQSYCPYSLKAKELLEAYDLHPPPRIFEVDHRPDMDQLKGVLTRLTSRSTWPNVILKGKSIGGSDELHELHEKGSLPELLEKAGVSIGSEGARYGAKANKTEEIRTENVERQQNRESRDS